MRTMRRISPKLHTYTGRLSYDMVAVRALIGPVGERVGNISAPKFGENDTESESDGGEAKVNTECACGL